jgi:hypothetical protein
MSEQRGLCLACGVPFPGPTTAGPTGLGTQSVYYLAYAHKKDDVLASKIDAANLKNWQTAPHVSHVFHHHHRIALEFMCNACDTDADMVDPWPAAGQPAMSSADPAVNLMCTFTKLSGAGKRPIVCRWPAPVDRRPFQQLVTLVQWLDGQGAASPVAVKDWSTAELNATYTCCTSCNNGMTQEGKFNYCVGVGAQRGENPTSLIPLTESPIEVWQASAHNRMKTDVVHMVDNRAHWTITGMPANLAHFRAARRDGRPETTMQPEGVDATDCVSAALAYYLHTCCPGNAALAHRSNAKRLYLTLSMLLLQVLTLVMVKKEGRSRQSMKTYLGTAEFYIALALWSLLCFGYPAVGERLTFVQFHQKYLWTLKKCKHPRGGSLLDRMELRVDVSNTPQALQRLADNLVKLFRDLHPLWSLLLDETPLQRWDATGLLPADDSTERYVRSYFLSVAEVPKLVKWSLRCDPGDVDSYLEHFGVRALLFRVGDLDVDPSRETRSLLKEFCGMWQRLEVENVARNSLGRKRAGGGISRQQAGMLYRLCTLLYNDAPELTTVSDMALQRILGGPQCSPWASVPALKQIKAFKTW